MMRIVLFFLIALVAGVASFVIYSETRERPAPDLTAEGQELAWLRAEFNLNDEQFDAIERLHVEYQPVCEELCNEVIDVRQRLDEAISSSQEMTGEIEARLEEYALVKKKCNRAMLGHAYEVAAHLPEDERRRYLDEVRNQVIQNPHSH